MSLTPPRSRLFRPLEIVLLATVVVMGLAVWAYRSLVPDDPTGPGAPGAPATSVAVLPFENVGGEPDDEYFSQGVSDEIRTALARVPGLEVASRTSSYAHGRSGGSVAEIAEVLGVGSILEGTVQRADERVRVTVTLVDVATDRQLWSETFDRELNVENLFAVEGEIAREVATALQIELGQTSASLAGQAPASLEAHDLYLLGLYHWNRRTGDEMLRAAGFFRESAALDPDYALAHAGLATTYVLLPLYAGVSAHEAMPSARAAARRALALDPTLAEAHAALAMVRTVYDFAWEEAETSFRRALELSPSYATGHQWYAVLLDVRGRFGEARTHHERALALDPLSGIINETYGNHLIFTEQYDRARVQLRHTLELLPDLPLALLFLGEVDLLTGAFDDAERTLRRWATVTGHEPEPWSRVVAGMRDPDAMGDAMQALSGLGEAGVLSPYWQAQYHALLEDRDEAVQALRRGMEERDFLMFFVSVDPAFNALRNDEGFRDAMAEMIPRGTGGDD